MFTQTCPPVLADAISEDEAFGVAVLGAAIEELLAGAAAGVLAGAAGALAAAAAGAAAAASAAFSFLLLRVFFSGAAAVASADFAASASAAFSFFVLCFLDLVVSAVSVVVASARFK